MTRPIVGITHDADQIPRHFLGADLARLEAVAEVRTLGRERAAILPQLASVDILLGSWGMPKLDAELLAAAPRLRAVAYAAGTVKGFVTDESYARGVAITTAMHANAVPVAEVTVALITLANKNWFLAQADMRAGKHHQNLSHVGNFGTTVGLVGFGAIARLVAERLATMDLTVLVYDPHAKDLPAGCERVADLVDLARRCDVVSLHAPDIPATHGMCDAAFFQAMRDGATFINTARGKLVDEAALISELETGRITAHLDVTHPEPPVAGSPLYSLPNVYLTPHLAGSSSGEIRRMGRLAIEECLALIAGRAPRYAVTQDMLATMA
jgi:phosphoglycerate dehydrogenase-like enzyme